MIILTNLDEILSHHVHSHLKDGKTPANVEVTTQFLNMPKEAFYFYV